MLVGKNTSSVVWLCSLASHRGWQAPAEFVLALTLHKSMHCEGITDTLLHYEGCFELWSADKVSRSFVGLRRTLSITAVLHHWRWANCSETRDWLSTWWDIHRIMWQKFNFIKVCIKRDFTMEHFLHMGHLMKKSTFFEESESIRSKFPSLAQLKPLTSEKGSWEGSKLPAASLGRLYRLGVSSDVCRFYVLFSNRWSVPLSYLLEDLVLITFSVFLA